MQVMVVVGEQVRRWRLRRAMTQAELAGKANVGINTIVRIELGHVQPRPPTLKRLAEALDVDPTELTD